MPTAKRMRMPLAKPVLRCDKYLRLIVGGTYGYARVTEGKKKFHGGVDRYAEPGTDCYAIYEGIVMPCCRDQPGTVIGKTGTSGNSSPHYPRLHFEIWGS